MRAPALVTAGADTGETSLPLNLLLIPETSIWVTADEAIVLEGRTREADPRLVLARTDPKKTTKHLIGDVYDAVAARLEKLDASRGDKGAHSVYLAIEGDVPMSTVIDVMYSTGRAGITAWEFATKEKAGPGSIRVAPPFCYPDQPAQRCIQPTVFLALDGTFIGTRENFEGGCGTEELAEPEESDPPAWSGKMLVGTAGTCPALPDAQGSAILSFVQRIKKLGDLCDSIIVGSENPVAWATVAPVMAALQTSGEFPTVIIEAGAPEGSCDPPFVLE